MRHVAHSHGEAAMSSGAGRKRLRKLTVTSLGLVALTAGLATPLAHATTSAPTSTTPCTMVGTGTFTSGGNQIHKEDSLSTDTTAPQKLVLRSLTGPSRSFRLSSLTSGSCHLSSLYPPEETGTPVNVFTGTG